MENREDILKELQAIAPMLAGMEKANPYRVPESYFLNFQSLLIEKIKSGEVKAELNVIAPELSRIAKPVAVNAPADYFSSFSSKLVKNIRSKEVLNELLEVAPELASIEKVNVYHVPAHYFNALPQQILKQVKNAQVEQVTAPGWIDTVNGFLDRVAAVVFKPKYAMAFSGGATMVFIGALMMMKIEQCSDLDCRFAQLTNDEISNYLEHKTDAYSDEVFEGSFDANQLPSAADKDNTLRGYKDALKDVDDAALDAAIAN
jgi:hypothetical protein